MRKPSLFAVATLALLVLAVMADGCARWGAARSPFTDEGVNPAFVQHVVDKADERLSFTPEQRQECRRIVEKLAAAAYARRQESKELRTSLAAEVAESRMDPSRLDQLYKRKMGMFDELYQLGRDDLLAFHATLSEEQRAKLSKIIAEHQRKGWHGSHGW